EGPRVHVAALMLNGICHVAESPPAALAEITGRAASALGISDGPVVSEIVSHQDVPHVAEFSARLCGTAFLAAATRLALGETVAPDDLKS
ncbi:MAG TPA: hypothetical protein VEM35_11085, partial [Rhizomicrobium sp.]|nr:hypothetical protein [Rhizomicrobium sp.]